MGLITEIRNVIEENNGLCKNYRQDLDQCRAGCKVIKIFPNDICPWGGWGNDLSRAGGKKTICPCYR